MRCGARRWSALSVATGTDHFSVSSIGPPRCAAAGAAASASANSVPEATYTTGTPGSGNASTEIAAAVAYRSAPCSRVEVRAAPARGSPNQSVYMRQKLRLPYDEQASPDP